MVKEIIIDGVDVAWCVRLQDDKISCYLGGECKGWENCYYKQLKHKEQECEELKKERDTLSITRNKLLDDLCVTEENLKDYTEHFNKASDELDQLKAENDKLKQILTEIKEICRFNFTMTTTNLLAKTTLQK